MTIYLYELPTTGAISFADFCVDESPSSSYTTHIAEATQARANLRGALKENKRTDRDEKDYLRLVKVLDDYLPHLRGIMSCVHGGELSIKQEPIFSWRTTLSTILNPLNSSPRLSMPSLHADLAFSLLTYAFALSNLAHSIVNSLGNYEHERAISDIERKAKDEKLNFAVTLLCRASGIFSHLSESVLVDWGKYQIARTGDDNTIAVPPDLNKEVNSALAKMALADAQTLAIRKLLSKSAYDSTLTPGPPLPKSHPSPALIAKLHLECGSLYSSARSLAMTPGKSKFAPGSSGEISIDLRRYLADGAAFSNASARKWLGIDAGENGGRSKGGEAVAFCIWAKKDLEDLKDSGKGLGIGKEKEQKERKKQKVLEELESVNVFLKHYKQVNDSLTFQPVPAQMDLQARIPAGRLAIVVKPFSLHAPAFGPGSIEHARREVEKITIPESEFGTQRSTNEDSDSAIPRSKETYAGAGSYF